jgi:ATP-dependent HslUV protease subunit HslV
MDKDAILVVSGTGEVIAPDDDLIAIGSGGNYALSAGRAIYRALIIIVFQQQYYRW